MPSDNESERKKDTEKLRELLSQLETWLTRIIADRTLLKNDLIHGLISELWHDQLRRELRNIQELLLSENQFAAKLEQAGLTGNQLNLKFVIFNNFISSEVMPEKIADPAAFALRSPKRSPLTKRIASGILEFFNSLLGSLSIVIPMAESIKEFKDMIHFEIEHGSSSHSAEGRSHERF